MGILGRGVELVRYTGASQRTFNRDQIVRPIKKGDRLRVGLLRVYMGVWKLSPVAGYPMFVIITRGVVAWNPMCAVGVGHIAGG